MNNLNIYGQKIGEEQPTFIIAEAGINHDGDINLAKDLVLKASDSGADAVKFQIFKAEEFCSVNSEYFNLFKDLEISEDEWIEIAEFAKDKNILFTASVFGDESLEILDKTGSTFYKTASGDITYKSLLQSLGKKGKPIILSTGMATIGDIEEALNFIRQTGNSNIGILHCVSNYPTDYKETNLNVIKSLKKLFQIPVGFSDHTNGTIIPAIAVALGANIIEKHFTIDKSLPGPDHNLSLEPNEFKEMVNNIKITEMALGDGSKIPTEPPESINAARRSIFVNRDIKEGEQLEKDILNVLRPAIGIEPKYLNFVDGKNTNKDIKKENPLLWEDIR